MTLSQPSQMPKARQVAQGGSWVPGAKPWASRKETDLRRSKLITAGHADPAPGPTPSILTGDLPPWQGQPGPLLRAAAGGQHGDTAALAALHRRDGGALVGTPCQSWGRERGLPEQSRHLRHRPSCPGVRERARCLFTLLVIPSPVPALVPGWGEERPAGQRNHKWPASPGGRGDAGAQASQGPPV